MQGGVDLLTNLQDLKVNYGMFELRPEREGARNSLKYILGDIADIKKYYIKLGFHLNEFEQFKYYEDFGFVTMAEFCEANLAMDKGAYSRCINVFKEFSLKTGEYNTSTMYVDEKYVNYSYSQLCEMLPLDADKRRMVTPDMTVKQIRELKKKDKNQNVVVATSQPDKEAYKTSDFENQEYISAMLHAFKKEIQKLCPDYRQFCISGKQLSFADWEGNEFSILYRVKRRK